MKAPSATKPLLRKAPHKKGTIPPKSTKITLAVKKSAHSKVPVKRMMTKEEDPLDV